MQSGPRGLARRRRRVGLDRRPKPPGLAVTTPARSHESRAAFHANLLASVPAREWTDLAQLDVLLLRSDAYEHEGTEPSLQMAAIRFGQVASRLCCGRTTFLLRPDDGRNINQIIAAATRDGYVVVQEFVPQVLEGTTRPFFLEGEPLQVGGHYAAVTQCPSDGDFRSNSKAGGTVAPAVMDDLTLRVAAEIGPILAADGLFLVGIDVAGGKVLDVGATAPGGLRGAERFAGVRFAPAVVDAIESRSRLSGVSPHPDTVPMKGGAGNSQWPGS